MALHSISDRIVCCKALHGLYQSIHASLPGKMCPTQHIKSTINNSLPPGCSPAWFCDSLPPAHVSDCHWLADPTEIIHGTAYPTRGRCYKHCSLLPGIDSVYHVNQKQLILPPDAKLFTRNCGAECGWGILSCTT